MDERPCAASASRDILRRLSSEIDEVVALIRRPVEPQRNLPKIELDAGLSPTGVTAVAGPPGPTALHCERRRSS